jgi:hypothetical protein
MNTNPEAFPTTWTTSDENFFRIVHDAFPAAFLAGASVLLGSYDIETATAAATEQCVSTAPAAPAAIRFAVFFPPLA